MRWSYWAIWLSQSEERKRNRSNELLRPGSAQGLQEEEEQCLEHQRGEQDWQRVGEVHWTEDRLSYLFHFRFRDWKIKKEPGGRERSNSLSRKLERQRSFNVKPPRWDLFKWVTMTYHTLRLIIAVRADWTCLRSISGNTAGVTQRVTTSAPSARVSWRDPSSRGPVTDLSQRPKLLNL